MAFSRTIKITFLLFSAVSLMSCKPSDADVHRLIEKTLDNMVYVEGGTFMMGDAGANYTDEKGVEHNVEFWTGYTDNKPAHKVTLDSYYIQKYEVTYAEYDTFTKKTGRPLSNDDQRKYPEIQPRIPAGVPSWYAAKDYCLWLGEQSGLPFDLPTEAQWEYAARSRGKPVPYATDTGMLDKGRNYMKYIKEAGNTHIVYVGSHPPNSLGIYDMHGNVNEWVNDWYDENYYKISPENNPAGPKTGEKKVLRGGSVIGTQSFNTVYARFTKEPDYNGFNYNGVRCVLNLADKADLKSMLKK
ncbi:MAG: SUMF1/EgtB/PvdO family nonheme iron enzyme [Gammaproteobacteria bacterium]|jgi:formylglycine-generating enzyme required for sulfatase activity